MKIYPAIDISGGKAVRLVQGDYDRMTVYSEDPVRVACEFFEAGARHLHLVDLDGAKEGEPKNFEVIKDIANNVKMSIEIGGGIRTAERIEKYLSVGADNVILGTIAAEDPAFTREAIKRYGEAVVVGVDARDGKVSTKGWTETTDIDSIEFCKELEDAGVKRVVYTDISRDGAMAGTNVDIYRILARETSLKITASGGISRMDEIETLKEITHAAILGKALYTGALDLAECVRISGEQ